MRQVGSFEMGALVAKWWLPDLENLPDKTITISLSSDAFSKTDDAPSKAQQMAKGINSVLGPYGSFLLKFTDEERLLMSRGPSMAERLLQQHRQKADGKFFIVLKPASKDTEARWGYVRDLLRFRPIVQETENELKERLMETFSRGEGDGGGAAAVEAYERELSKIKKPDSEALPRLQVWKGKCPQLVRCMEEAKKDDDSSEDAKSTRAHNPNKVRKWDAIDGVGGDDALESFGHGAHHFKDVEKTMPKAYYIQDQMEKIQTHYEDSYGERITDPTRLVMVQMTQSARFDAQHANRSGGLNIARAGSNRHRTPHGRNRAVDRPFG